MTELIEGETILVTGGAGFVGSHLVDALAPDNEVIVVDDFSNGRRANIRTDAVTVLEGDVSADGTLEAVSPGVDIVFHEAAVVSVEESVSQPRRCHGVNVDGTLAVLDWARALDARVVLASSAAVYGTPRSVPIAEDHPQNPNSPYGLDKSTVDSYADLYHDLYGLETVTLRYFNIYGPRQAASDYSGVVSIFAEQAQSGGPITVDGDGRQTRDFVHVEDVVRANLLAATTPAVGESFNIGTGQQTSVLDVAETMQSLVDPDPEIVHGAPRPGDIEHSCANISKAREALGYEPTVSLETGLRSLVE